MRGRRRRRLTLVAACVFFAGACGTEATEHSDDAGQSSGPWAEEFESAYNSTDSEFAKEVLADGVITDAEVAEAEHRVLSCMEEKGYSDVTIFADGRSSYAINEGDDLDKADQSWLSCEESSGYGSLWFYYSMKVNPNNEEWDPLVVQCLKDKEVVEPSFTESDLDHMFDTGEISDHFNDDDWHQCLTDPLGML